MNEYDAKAEERIARETYHDADFLGIDGEGSAHYWSIYHQAVVVLDGETVEGTYELANTPLTSLAEWLEHTRQKRGAWESTRTCGSVTALVTAAVDC